MVSLALDSRELAETYDRVGERQFNHGKRLIERLDPRPGERVLDVGCGTGRLAAYVAARVAPSGKVDAVDPLPLRVALARAKGLANLEAQVGSAEDLSAFGDRSFDVVFMNSVFHWLPEKRRPLAEARRVLKRGGRLGISTAAADRPHDFELLLRQVFARPELSDVKDPPTGAAYKVSSEELRALLEEAAFGAIELHVLSFVDHFESAEDVFSFNVASSFGNFLSSLSAEQRTLARDLLGRELERRRGRAGIRLERHLSFAVARRPD